MDAATIALVSGIIGYNFPPLTTNNQGATEYVHVSKVNSGEMPECVGFDSVFAPKSKIDDAVQKGESYQVVLKSTHIGNQLPVNWANLFSKSHSIAILASAFEMSDESTATNSKFDFSNQSAESAKVVYFNDDIRKGQMINASQVPMYGPITYNGNPVGISMFVLQVVSNEENNELSGMFSNLADLGKKALKPSPVLDALQSVGKSLIEKRSDDKLLRYDTMFLSHQYSSDLNHVRSAFLRYGDYVLIRQQQRNKPIDWSRYYYNYDYGRVYTNPNCTAPLEDLSYGVVHINKAKNAAYSGAQTLGELRALVNETKVKDKEVSKTLADTLLQVQLKHDKYIEIETVLELFKRIKRDKSEPSSTEKYDLNHALSELAKEDTINPKSSKDFSSEQIYALKRIIVEITENPVIAISGNALDVAKAEADILAITGN